jgi:hypothetical protein
VVVHLKLELCAVELMFSSVFIDGVVPLILTMISPCSITYFMEEL